MISRRKFSALLGASLVSQTYSSCNAAEQGLVGNKVVSTWNNQQANKVAMEQLVRGPQYLLDAIEKGINYVEADPNDTSVGYGGRPDREGFVTLDACIMDKDGRAGSVTYLEHYMHAISVARKVMEETPHVILSGDGAAQFASEMGFVQKDLMTEESRSAYHKWLEKAEYQPKINVERHDTIGMLALNKDGDLSGGCSTSGLAYKMRGRVGDSPIIGAGLYVDNRYGAAVATGLGELVLRQLSSFLVVELMRSGQSPQKACEEAIFRIVESTDVSEAQVGLIAMNRSGKVGGYSIHPGFNYAITDDKSSLLKEAPSYIN
jgi:N4-(beta-N-acetylglucosaminyl)-L-asparaginase